jgi:hypothetical protein
VLHIDDLVEPGSEQILFTRLAPFAWFTHSWLSDSPRKPSESRFANQANLKLILQGNCPFRGRFLQLENLQILRFFRQISGFRVLHGRRFTTRR